MAVLVGQCRASRARSTRIHHFGWVNVHVCKKQQQLMCLSTEHTDCLASVPQLMQGGLQGSMALDGDMQAGSQMRHSLRTHAGFCSGGACHVFAALVDEFGSTLQGDNETNCMSSILAYLNGAGGSGHARITSFFFWRARMLPGLGLG